jgi:hypothetical protein
MTDESWNREKVSDHQGTRKISGELLWLKIMLKE